MFAALGILAVAGAAVALAVWRPWAVEPGASGVSGAPEPSSTSSKAPSDWRGSPDGDPADVSRVPTAPPEASRAPASTGATLARLTEPPKETLVAVSPDKCDEGVVFTILFEPYGIGPGSFGPSIVAKVVSAKAEEGPAKFPDIAGRNVVLVLGELEVPAGGLHTAKGRTAKRDDMVYFKLTEVTPARGQ